VKRQDDYSKAELLAHFFTFVLVAVLLVALYFATLKPATLAMGAVMGALIFVGAYKLRRR
jgi:hypothetical protein